VSESQEIPDVDPAARAARQAVDQLRRLAVARGAAARGEASFDPLCGLQMRVAFAAARQL